MYKKDLALNKWPIIFDIPENQTTPNQASLWRWSHPSAEEESAYSTAIVDKAVKT